MPLGTFTGRIVNQEGNGIEGAVVTLPNDRPHPPLAVAVSDSCGRFRMPVSRFEEVVIHRICHSLKIQAEGFSPTYVDQRHLSLFEEATTDIGEIVMDLGRSYSGRVVHQDGKPIAGAIVAFNINRFQPGSTWIPISDEAEVLTDEHGRFKTTCLGGGIPWIGCHAQGFQYAYYSRSQFAKVALNGQLPDLILHPEFPIHGIVRNETGEPLAGVTLSESNRESTTDQAGKFTLHGLGSHSRFQCQIVEAGYASVNLLVEVVDNRLEILDLNEARHIEERTADHTLVPGLRRAAKRYMSRLEITLLREATIQGQVVDAETNQPVKFSRIVLCGFSRNDNGEVILDGCHASNANQIQPGLFSLTYSKPREYHLTVIADGYEEGEAYTPSVTTLLPIDGIVVKLKRKGSIANAPVVAKQTIVGTIQLGGEPIDAVRAAIWTKPRATDIVNANVIRGRTSIGDGYVWDTQMLNHGEFTLDVSHPADHWYVLVETPKRVVALEGPFAISTGETKSIELHSRRSGSLRGEVRSDQPAIGESLYAILFSDLGLQYETRVAVDGSFEFLSIFPGSYGLKIGTDAIIDSEIPGHNEDLSEEECWKWNQVPSDPWKRAIKVEVCEGELLDGIVVLSDTLR